MAKLKVYGGITYGAEGQFRTVVAATSKSKAASILNITIYQMNSVTNGAIVIHTQRLKSDPGGNLLS